MRERERERERSFSGLWARGEVPRAGSGIVFRGGDDGKVVSALVVMPE